MKNRVLTYSSVRVCVAEHQSVLCKEKRHSTYCLTTASQLTAVTKLSTTVRPLYSSFSPLFVAFDTEYSHSNCLIISELEKINTIRNYVAKRSDAVEKKMNASKDFVNYL